MKDKKFEHWLLRSRYNIESIFEPFCTSVKEIKSGKYKGEYEYSYDCRDFHKLPFMLRLGIYLEYIKEKDTPLYKELLIWFVDQNMTEEESIKKAFELLK